MKVPVVNNTRAPIWKKKPHVCLHHASSGIDYCICEILKILRLYGGVGARAERNRNPDPSSTYEYVMTCVVDAIEFF